MHVFISFVLQELFTFHSFWILFSSFYLEADGSKLSLLWLPVFSVTLKFLISLFLIDVHVCFCKSLVFL